MGEIMDEIILLTEEQKEKENHIKKSLALSEIIETKGIYYNNHPID